VAELLGDGLVVCRRCDQIKVNFAPNKTTIAA
jgi:hypothetical protein